MTRILPIKRPDGRHELVQTPKLRHRYYGTAGQRALLATILIVLLLLVIFILLGGTFDISFWRAFLPGLLGNLVILALAVFFIDRMFKKERGRKLEQANARHAQFILLINNILALRLLEYLELASSEPKDRDDPGRNYEFAIEMLRPNLLRETFFQKLDESDAREKFVKGFAEELIRGVKGLAKALEGVFPHPHPTALKLVDEMTQVAGALDAIGAILESIAETNRNLAPGDQLQPAHVQLILKILSEPEGVGSRLDALSANLVELSNMARSNNLFLDLD